MTSDDLPHSGDPISAAPRSGARLSSGEQAALTNLARKLRGKEVGWITISDARALTEMGLAARSHQGWSITDAGSAAFAAMTAKPPNVLCVVQPITPV